MRGEGSQRSMIPRIFAHVVQSLWLRRWSARRQVSDMMLEGAQGGDVGGHGVVVIPAGDDASQPSSLFGDRRVPPPSEFLLEFMQLGAHPVASRLPPKQEAAAPGASADMREPQEVETLRLAQAAPLAVRRRRAAELDEARLFRMQRQREPRHPLVQLRPEPLGVGLVLEAGDDVVGVAHEDDVALGVAFCAIVAPRGRRRNAGRCSPAAVRSPRLAAFRSPSASPARLPSPRPSAICGSGGSPAGRRCGARRTGSATRGRPRRRTPQCRRPAPSSPSCCRFRPIARPAHRAGRVRAETRTRIRGSPPRKPRSAPRPARAGRSCPPARRCRAGAAARRASG